MQDTQMVDAILSGDRKALYVLYRTHAPRLARLIRLKVADPADCDEILQDTLFAFLEAIRDYRGEASISTFLTSICQHKIIDHYRKKKFKHTVFSRTPELESLVSPILNPEEALDAVLLKERLRRALGKLLPQYRHVLLSKYLENLSVSEIAERFAVSFKSAESLLFRARKAFVKTFAHT